MCSGRKKPPEALQVQDHRALGKAEAWSPLWQGAWKPGCLPEAYLVLRILCHPTELSRKSGGQEVPHRGRGAPCGCGVYPEVRDVSRSWSLRVGWPHEHLPGPASALPWGVCMLECSTQPVGDGFATLLANLWKIRCESCVPQITDVDQLSQGYSLLQLFLDVSMCRLLPLSLGQAALNHISSTMR